MYRLRLQMTRSMWMFVVASLLCAGLVLGVATSATWSAGRALLYRGRANGMREQRRVVTQVFVEVLRAESCLMGFLLTGKQSLLEPLDGIRKTLDGLYTRLRTMADESILARQLEQTARLRMETLRSTIALAARSDQDRIQLISADWDLRALRDLREVHERFESELQTREVSASRLVESTLKGTRALTLGGGVVCCLLLLALNLSMTRLSAESERSRVLAEDRAAEAARSAEAIATRDEALKLQIDRQRDLVANLATTNAALSRSNQDLDQFAYVASHDLKAPLRGISHLATWIEEDLGEAPPGVKEHVRLLHGRVARLEMLIEGILDYSRASRPAQKPAETIDLGRLISDVITLIAARPDVKIHVSAPLPSLFGHRVQLEQVLMNLIGNALKHGCANGGEITVSAKEQADRIHFSIKDNGPGIEPKYHERIFGIFQRLVARDEVEGAGVGLSVVKRLVERHGGSIRIVSQPGRGAEFQFDWPKTVHAG